MEGQLYTATPGSELDRAAEVFRRVLVPVDFTDDSHAAVYMALELKRRFGSDVCVFNLTTLGANEDFRRGLGAVYGTGDLEAEGKEHLRTLLETLQPGASADVVTQVCVGEDVARWIHDVAVAWNATLVVLATHARHAVFRSLTEKIMRALNVPVFVLR